MRVAEIVENTPNVVLLCAIQPSIYIVGKPYWKDKELKTKFENSRYISK